MAREVLAQLWGSRFPAQDAGSPFPLEPLSQAFGGDKPWGTPSNPQPLTFLPRSTKPRTFNPQAPQWTQTPTGHSLNSKTPKPYAEPEPKLWFPKPLRHPTQASPMIKSAAEVVYRNPKPFETRIL